LADLGFLELGVRPEKDGDPPVHIYPLWGRKHELEGTDCWCEPELMGVCSQCDGEGCWNCDDGFISPCFPQDALIVIHDPCPEADTNPNLQ